MGPDASHDTSRQADGHGEPTQRLQESQPLPDCNHCWSDLMNPWTRRLFAAGLLTLPAAAWAASAANTASCTLGTLFGCCG